MANWLEKYLNPLIKAGQLPVARQEGAPGVYRGARSPRADLPSASVIYGIAASVLSIFGTYILFTGRWFAGLVMILLAGCMLCFALHFLRYPPR